MAEPTTATVCIAAAAGLSAAFCTYAGVDPQALVWGTIGAIFGVAFAPPSGKFRAAILFLGVVFASALLGTYSSEYWFQGSRTARNASAMLLAVVFHPLLAAFVQAAPAALQALIRARSGGGNGQP